MIILPSLNEPALFALLTGGAVGVMPTDTIYGLAALARDREAVEKLYRLKKRERKPGTVIAADVAQLMSLGVNESMLHSVEHLWPDSLSIVIPAAEELAYLDQGMGLAVRIPKDEQLRAVLSKVGPLVTSSANHPGQPPANTITEAQAYFGENVAFYVDGGDLSGRPPSTVVRLHENGQLEVLRQGAVIVGTERLIA
jgi:L-threonylcarbamoyladenylate synthase